MFNKNDNIYKAKLKKLDDKANQKELSFQNSWKKLGINVKNQHV